MRVFPGIQGALRLAAFFGTSAEFWMGLQADYDMARARAASHEVLARIRRFEPADTDRHRPAIMD